MAFSIDHKMQSDNSIFVTLPNESYGNVSYMTTNASHLEIEDDLYNVPPVIIVLLSTCYGLISLAAVLGNLCVLLIIATSRRMRTITNYFIANLATADIIIGLFSIPFQFQAALLQRWVLPPFMCAFCPFIQVLSVNVSIITLTAIALDRYRAVVHPLKARTSKLSAKLIIVSIWIFSAVASVPNLIALRVTTIYDPQTGSTKPFCHQVQMSPFMWKVYNHILVTIQYFLPLCLISVVYIAIGIKLRSTRPPGHEQDDRDANILRSREKVIKMLLIVVLLFALCWLPFQMYNILQEIFPEINSYKYINIIWFFCHWLAMSNSCYNPFIYAIYNERFNTEFRNKFRHCFSFFRSMPLEKRNVETSLSLRWPNTQNTSTIVHEENQL